jgi:signal transduction histidine kinase/putative methionine-R-sulfoxide reductase with GAF domain
LVKSLPEGGGATVSARGVARSARPSKVEDQVRVLEKALANRKRELLILSAVASRIHNQDDVDLILEATLQEILSGLGLDAAWVLLADSTDGKLRLAAQQGLSAQYLREVETEGLSDCLCPEVFSSRHRMQVRNTTECPRMPTIVEGLREPVAHACIPLNSEGPSRGVLNVAARPGQHFSEEELHFLETLGRQVCLAVERARHLEAERWHNREARALGALNKAIGQSLDLQAVLGAVGHTAGEILKVGGVTIFLGSDPRELTVAHVTGHHAPPLAEGRTVDLGLPEATLVRRALLHQKVVRIDDWSLAERQGPIPAPGWEKGSALLVPLVARQSVLGLLVLSRETPHRWGGDQVEIAEALAAQASVSLENARLYENARRAYRDLSEAQARIIESEKLAVVGTFAAGLAHEIRNPLNSIALQLSILERRSAPLEISVAREIEDLLAVIREEVKRLDNLVGDFLKFSGSGRLQHRPSSLDALVDEVMGLLQPEAGAAGVALDRRRPVVPLPDLPLDGEKIKQVLINLLQNAIEAQPDGGRVIVETALHDSTASVVVADRGPGLPPGLDVFQLFVTTKARGTGLGLAIAQQIVLDHGGEIRAESTAGEGATFTISLPAAHAASGQTESP